MEALLIRLSALLNEEEEEEEEEEKRRMTTMTRKTIMTGSLEEDVLGCPGGSKRVG
jgi:hypothetical protein